MNCRMHRMLHQIVLGCVFAVLGPLGAFNVGGSAQSYAFGRADVGTGASPAAIVTGDFNGDSKLDLATVNSVDNTVSILLGKPDGTFQPHLDLKVGSFPLALATGDFNGDGKLDLAVINSGDSTVSILRGNGDGTFQTAVSYAVGPFPSSVVSGDFRGDGKLDLAVGYDDGSVSILLGNGDGTFRAPAKLSGNPGNPAAVGDFNGDGRQDLVVTFGCSLSGGSEPPGSISILLANGDGTFRTSWHQDVACGLVSVAVGDFNGDGKLDLASQGSLLLGNGDGTFQAGLAYTTSENCSVFPSCWGSVVAGDFNGDGRLDLAAENTDFPTVSLLIGNGDGTFQATVEYTISAGPMIAGDFNGDGADDLAVIGYNPPNTLSVLLSGFGGKDIFAGVYYPTVPVDHYCTAGPTSTGDFNADGKLDLAVSYSCSCCAPEDYGVVVTLLGNGDGTFPVSPNLADVVGANPSSLAVEDFNKDGKPDLVVATSGCAPGLFPGCGPAGVSVLLGNGDGTFQTAVNYSAGLGPSSVAVGDFNGDGKLDLAVSNAGSDNVSVLLGNGDGIFQAAANYGAGSGPISVAVGDFNSDGKLDLAVANGMSNNVTLLLGNGDGSFRPGSSYGVTSGLWSIVVGDFNGDGRLDLAVASGASNPEGVPASVTVSVLLGNGNGSFQSPMTFSTGAPAVFPLSLSMAVTDLNGDGKLDIVMPSSILLGKGDGTFQAFPPPSNELVSVAVGDFDGDGNIDLAGPIGSFYPSFSAFFNRPVVALYPTNVAFPAQNSPTITQKLTVSNPGLVSLKISSVVAEGNFAQTNDCGSVLPAGAACSITVTFAPTTTGTSKGAIIIADGAPGSPHLISLTGTVSPVVTLSSTSLNFGHHLVGGPSQPQTVTLTNTGNMPLFITSLVTSGDFAQANTCGDSVPVGASCTISVTFTPTTLGTRAGTITIKDNAAESPQVVPLTGIGTEISLSVTSLTFPAQNVGMSVARPVVLTNHGSTPVSVTTVEVTGDFRATKLCTSVQPHGRCATNVLFKPTQTGLRTGELTITDSDPGSPQTVTLTGTGR